MPHVALTTGGRFLRLARCAGEDRVTGDAGSLDTAELFERVELPHGRVALRTHSGHYLARRPDQGQNFGLYPEPELSPAAVFEEILWPDGQVSLRSADLTYVGARTTAVAVTVNRVEAGPSERFRYVTVPTVPAQRRPATGAHRAPASLSG